MSVLPIRTVPDPVLRKKAKKVSSIDASVQKLIDDMLETMHDDPGRAGLAAPQVGVSLRVIVIGAVSEDVPDDVVLINPEIVKKAGQRTVTEGCLSVPGYAGELARAESVTVKGRNREGKEVRLKATGLLAQALEHEIDHLNGWLYLEHIETADMLWKIPPPGLEEAENLTES